MKRNNIAYRIILPLTAFILVLAVFGILMIHHVMLLPHEPMKKSIEHIAYTFGATSIVLIVFIFVLVKKNLVEPLMAIRRSILEGTRIEPTWITEVDTLIDTINNAVATAELKQRQVEMLYETTTSLNASLSFDETLKSILDSAQKLIHSDLSALALTDEKGNFKRLLTYGISEQETLDKIGRLPSIKGLLKLIHDSPTPVRIDDVMTHPDFSGKFPDGHPAIKGLIGTALFTGNGRKIGFLFFANKSAGPFTADDEWHLKAISISAAIAIEKAETIEKLENFKRLSDSSFDVIIITDTDGAITYVNRAFENITGYEKSEALGLNPRLLKSGVHGPEFYKALWSKITGGQVWKGEMVNRRKNGDCYSASVVIFPLLSDEGRITDYVAIQRDVTEEKRLHEHLIRAQKAEALGTLASGIAHDFNNVLTGILGYSELMLTRLREGDPLYKPASIIMKAAESGAELTKKMLSISRKETFELKPVSLNDLIVETRDLLSRSIPKNIDIRLSLREHLPLINADFAQMQQVILNLAVNARDAMPEGGRLAIETTVVGKEQVTDRMNDPEGPAVYVKLTVSDTGMGMDHETTSSIFDPFFTTKEKGRGTGLGLYTVHSTVRRHDGTINVYSEPGKGTRFNIYIPACGETASSEELKAGSVLGEGAVLFIDDEEGVRELAGDMLSSLGYTAILAGSGPEGMKLFRENRDRITAVVLDIIMPDMGGPEVFRTLRKEAPDVRVLICSGYSNEGFEGINDLMKSGASGFLQKPFTMQSFGKTLKKILTDQPE